jgi:tRNA A37 threonylcarbamoyladenosine dehydratase
MGKAKLMQERMLQINPFVKLNVISEFQDPEKMMCIAYSKSLIM